MQERLSLQEDMMVQKDKALVEAKASLDAIQHEMTAWQSQHKQTHKRLLSEQASSGILKKELSYMQADLKEAKVMKQELHKLRTRVGTLEGVEIMLKDSKEEVDALVTSHKSSTTKLAMFVVALKRDYEVLKEKRADLVRDKSRLSEEINHAKKQLLSKEKELCYCQDQLSVLESDLYTAEEEKKTLQKKIEMLQAAIDSPNSRYALKRILESPMPDHLAKNTADLGASPLLVASMSRCPADDTSSSNNQDLALQEPIPNYKVGTKRQFSSKENIILPVSKKIFKSDNVPKIFSAHVLKKGLKFAPRKNHIHVAKINHRPLSSKFHN